jgi:hypothetical protein
MTSPTTTKVKATSTANKVMLTVFWDNEGVFVDFL